MNKIQVFALSSAFAVAVGSAQAGELIAGFNEYATNFVAEGQTQVQNARVIQSAEGRIYKTGAGRWQVPVDVADQNGTCTFSVKQGTLAFTSAAGNVTKGTKPDAVLARAALWLDATVNTVEGETAGRIHVWRDPRDTSAAATNHVYGVAESVAGKSMSGQDPLLTTYADRTALYFGGFGNGQYLALMKPDGSGYVDIQRIHNTFVVHAVDQTFGNILGSYVQPADFSRSGENIYWSHDQQALAASMGRTYVDGKLVDGKKTPPPKGYWLFETKLTDPLGHVEALFTAALDGTSLTTRSFGSGWQGGDYISEVLLFTNQLTEVERLQVESYLMHKWNLASSSGILGVKLAEGARVEVSDAGCGNGMVVSGEGVLQYTGTGTFENAADSDFAGTLAIGQDNATVQTRGARDFAYNVEAGKTVSATVTDEGYFFQKKPGTANTFTKQGLSVVKVREVPSNVKQLKVEGGVLTLSGVQPEAMLVAGSAVNVPVPNADFEQAVSGGANFNVFPFTVDAERYGWTAVAPKTAGASLGTAGVFNGIMAADYALWYVGRPPEGLGKQAVYFGPYGGFYTHVTLPEDGEYELSCWTSSRAGYNMNGRFDVMLGATWETAEHVATLYTETRAFQKRTVLLPYRKAGTYVLGFRRPENLGSSEACKDSSALDGIRLTLKSEPSKKNRWPLPNGDFEQVLPSWPKGPNANTPYYVTFWDDCDINFNVKSTRGVGPKTGWINNGLVNPDQLSTHLQGEHWTLSKVGWLGSRNEQPVEFMCSTTPFNHPYAIGMGRNDGANTYVAPRSVAPYDTAGTSYGGVVLFFGSTGGVATTTFTPPAGKYQLACRAMTRYLHWNCNNMSSMMPSVRARVTVGETVTDLGVISPRERAMQDFTWPVPFATVAGESVTLVLTQEHGTSVAITDDYVLVPANPELIVNGGFESGTSGWTFEDDPAGTWSVGVKDSPAGPAFGWSQYEGSKHVRICGRSRISQPVTLDTNGEYRLEFHAFGRYALNAWGPGYNKNYGEATIEALFVQGGATNIVYRSPIYATNYVSHVCTFRAPGEGTWDFILRGTDSKDVSAFIDGVSLKKAPAPTTLPDVDDGTSIDVSSGAKLNLEYSGELPLFAVRLGGKSVTGVVDAQTYPDYVIGGGSIYVQPRGTLLIVR